MCFTAAVLHWRIKIKKTICRTLIKSRRKMLFRVEKQENSKIAEVVMNESLSEDEEDETGLESLGISS